MKQKTIEHRMKFLLGAVGLVLLILLARVSYLQLVQTDAYRTLARNNYIRIAPILAPRGEIFDRQGTKIVTNKPIYTVSINNLNLKGTTYHLQLNRTGADIVPLADQLAQILADDDEAVQYFDRSGNQTMADYAKETDINMEALQETAKGQEQEQQRQKRWSAFKKNYVEIQLKELIQAAKEQLEQGQDVEIAVVYHSQTLAALKELDLSAAGLTIKKETDVLSDLVELLLAADPESDQSAYDIESRVRQEISAKQVDRPYELLQVAEDIPPALVVALREKQMELPGVVVDVQPVREYPYRELFTHTLGYVQNIKQEQYEQNKDAGYLLHDLYGQNGLESIYEQYLRGTHGARQVEVDAMNRPVRDLGQKPPLPGNDLILTVDLDLQQAAENALREWIGKARTQGFNLAGAGSAVVMDVNTGAILALASYPGYHPGLFTGGLTGTQWQQLQDSGALLNRAIGATYPPGSTFKMVTSTAILENNLVDPSLQINCAGYYTYGSGIFGDWKPDGHGLVDLRKAIEVSCNPYFYHYGRQAGVEAIAHYAREYGLGEKSGIDLPGEVAGVVPTPQWKYELVKSMLINYNQDFARVRELNREIEAESSENRKQALQKTRDDELEKQLAKHDWELNWQQYETINMSIGQGDNTYTPLQLVTYVSAIANNGTLFKPYLVEKIVSPRNEIVQAFQPEVRRKIEIKPQNLKIIQEGMHQVTLPPTGTGASVFMGFAPGAAAKTGTTEVMDETGKKKGNHGLFVAYAPYEKPEVAVAVVVEFVDSGSAYAGPIARQILDAYFADDPPEPWVSDAAADYDADPAAENISPADWSNHLTAVKWPGLELTAATSVEKHLYGNLDLYRMLEQKQSSGSDTSPASTAPPVNRPTPPAAANPPPGEREEAAADAPPPDAPDALEPPDLPEPVTE